MANVENKLVQEMIEALESLLEGKVTLLREGSSARDDGIDYVFSIDTEHGKWICRDCN
ncbi:hypothetical protein HAX39_25455 [Citrobacter freundii]|nr:hypothetical protein [Citrobacter freundii]